MSVIDQRVVEMRFDNKQFESGVATTMSTLEKFKQSLNLTGATKGLEEVGSAAKRFDMSSVGAAVDTVRTKFSALEVMGITALANITNSAVNAGKRMVSALTVDPIKTGFQEYETQINAVQTILANTQSKGTTLDDVNTALDTLNTYADKTVYNFTEMTRNIGTFTAAGVGLDDSVSAIQGIANLAAVSGSTSQQASTAMYQLSQALASGTVKLMDWNSVVNAGMGGEVFQNALKETAKIHGVNIDKMIKKEGSFRETLKNGWLTSEILTETLENFTLAAEEGSKQWDEYKKSLMDKGYTEEQAESILKMANTATDAATKVKTFTQLWDTLKEAAQSGWTQTWEIIVGDFEEAKSLLTQVSDVIGKIIGDSAKARNDLLQGWKDAGGRQDLIDGLSNAFQAMINIMTPIKEAFREVFPPITVTNLTAITSGFKNLMNRFKEFTAGHADQIKSIFKGIFSVLDMGLSVIKAAASGISKLFGYLTGYSGSILDVAANLGDWITNLRQSAKETDIFSKAVEKIKGFLISAKDGLVEFGNAFKESFKFPGYEGALGFFQTLWEMICQVGSGAVKVFSALAKGLSEAFGSFDMNQLIGAINGGLIAGLFVTIKNFTKGLFDSFVGGDGIIANIKDILNDVLECLQAYQQQLKASTLLKIAGAIGILAASIFVISTIDTQSLGASLTAITVLFGELLGSLAIFSQVSGGSMKGVTKGIAVMTGMSVALVILASALKKLSTVDTAGLVKGLVGIGVLMAELSLFMRTAKFDGKMVGSATGIVILSSALHILVGAVRKFGELDPAALKQGLIGVGAILGELALFTRLTGNAKHVVATGTSMVLLGAALKILASAVKDFGSMSPEALGQGLMAMAASLTAITVAMNFMPKNMVGIGVGMVAVGGALMIIAKAMSSFGSMSWDEVTIGLTAMGGALVILTAALNLMNGTLAGSAALIVAAGALAILAPVMQQLGQMTWQEIGMGLATLAAAFGAIGIAGALLTPVIPSIIGLAGAFALFGVSTLAIGAGLSFMAASFTALAVAGTTGATAIVAALTIIITGIVNLIPAVCVQIANGIVAFAQAIAVGAPVIAHAIGVLLDEFLNLIVTYIPKIVDAGMKLILGLLEGVANNIQKVVETAVDVVLNFIAGIASSLPKIIQSGIDLMLSFINGMADGIRNNTDKVIAATDNLMDAIIGAVKKYFSHFTSKGKDLIGKMISGVKSKAADFKNTAKNMMDGFIKGVKDKFTSIKNTAIDAIKGAVDGVKSFLGIHSPSKLMATLGRFSMMGFAEGIDEDMTAEQAAEKKAQNIVKAFKEELDKRELDKTTLDLEYELKTANGESVNEADKLSKQLELQNERVQIASCEYELTMREFGETAEATQEAYNKLLREKIQMSELHTKLSQIQQQEFASNKASTKAYIAWMKESAKDLLAMGFSSAEINAAAKEQTGFKGGFYFDVGKNIAAGMTAGIESGTSDVKKASASMSDAAIKASESELQIHSPSRVFARIGRQSVEGMVAGLTKYAGTVKTAATNVGNIAMSSVSDAVSGISNVFGSDVDSNPIIRPVLDLSNIQNGATRINSMLGQPSLALSGIGSNGNMSSLLNQMQNRGHSNDDVVSAISELRGDFASLVNAINNMHIRLDSGTMVGELIGKIDSGLGQIANHKGRGN